MITYPLHRKLSEAIQLAEDVEKSSYVANILRSLGDPDDTLSDHTYSTYWIRLFAREVLRDRWIEGEEIILASGDGYPIVEYARDMIGGRWPEAEEVILASGDADGARRYAEQIIGGRWPEAEEIILASCGTLESVTVSPRRDGEYEVLNYGAEDEIVPVPGDATDVYYYTTDVIGDRWPEGEAAILASGDTETIYSYATYVIRGRWPEGEKVILASGDAYAAIRYAMYVIGDRWPEAERIMRRSRRWREYADHFGIARV